MSDLPAGTAPSCTAATRAGKPCTYPAEAGSDPPLCALHGQRWLQAAAAKESADFYNRYLARRESPGALTAMEQRTLRRELVVARAILAQVLDLLLEPEEIAEPKIFVPIALRCVKLIADLIKQMSGSESDGHWDAVLDRLADELDIDL